MMRLATLALAISAGAALGQGYPERDITVVVVWGEGGGTDSINRMIMAEMAPLLGVNIEVTNITGGPAGTNGLSHVFEQPADGYTLVGLSESNVTAGVQGGFDEGFDVWHPFIVGGSPDLVSSTPRSQYLTIEDLIAAARANPGQIKAAAGGAGSIHHLNLLAFEAGAGIDLDFIEYDGSGPSHQAALDREVDVVITSYAEQFDLIDQGKLFPLAILTPEEGAEIPSAFEKFPELAEFLPLSQAIGFAIRADAPQEVKDRLTQAFEQAVASRTVADWALYNAYSVSGLSGDAASEVFAQLEQTFAWTLDALGAAVVNPEELGIPRP